MTTIKIYNPRLMMRGGVSNMMEDAALGEVVILRLGEIAPCGTPLLVNPNTASAGKQFDASRDKVFKLVEVSAAELKRLEKALAAQVEQGIPATRGAPTRAANPNRAPYPEGRKPRTLAPKKKAPAKKK